MHCIHGKQLHFQQASEVRAMMEPVKIRMRRMRISCAKSVGCGFIARSQLPAIMATAIQLKLLKMKQLQTK